MKCKYSITIWLFLAVLLLVACDNGERQRLQLAELERQNRADSLMLNDSLARDLADWFDRHGTRNEQLRAHYILGRTYADRGEAPAALDAYHEAISRADTTAQDCDYKTLSRVHAQKAELFYYQLLADNMIREERQAMRYALLARDTMQYLYCYGLMAEGYDMKDMADSALYFLNEVYKLYRHHCFKGYTLYLNYCTCVQVFDREKSSPSSFPTQYCRSLISLKVRQTLKSPTFSALMMMILSIFFPPYSFFLMYHMNVNRLMLIRVEIEDETEVFKNFWHSIAVYSVGKDRK